MSLHDKYKLTKIINARGTFTPIGVSRSSKAICESVSSALSEFFIIDELQVLASDKISQLTGAEAGCVTHCGSASITLSIAATMTSISAEKIALLPDASTMKNDVIIPTGHVINYGHSILQDIRLTGANPILIGKERNGMLEEFEKAFSNGNVTCLLLVSSRLIKDKELDLKKVISLAKKYDIPTIIDAAGQDFRCKELLETGADLVLNSPNKYMLTPTAGMVYGKKSLVDAVYANEKGIGRSMKATKEGIIGVLAGIEERVNLDLNKWSEEQKEKVSYFVSTINKINGLEAISIPDATNLPFSRACVSINENEINMNSCDLAKLLKKDSPQIWTIDKECGDNKLVFELIPLRLDEVDIIIQRLKNIVH